MSCATWVRAIISEQARRMAAPTDTILSQARTPEMMNAIKVAIMMPTNQILLPLKTIVRPKAEHINTRVQVRKKGPVRARQYSAEMNAAYACAGVKALKR